MRTTLLALSLLTAISSHALTVDEMLARFNKVKQKSKHRYGAVMESYINVHSELAASRSGSYEAADFGRTEITSDHTTFGLGVTGLDFSFGGATFDRLFYERKQRIDGNPTPWFA